MTEKFKMPIFILKETEDEVAFNFDAIFNICQLRENFVYIAKNTEFEIHPICILHQFYDGFHSVQMSAKQIKRDVRPNDILSSSLVKLMVKSISILDI